MSKDGSQPGRYFEIIKVNLARVYIHRHHDASDAANLTQLKEENNMSMDNLSLSDIASVTRDNDGFGGNSFFWVFALLLLAGGGFGGFGMNRGYGNGDFGTFATASSQNELLLGQKFDALGQKINSIGDGLCSSTYALNNAINGVGGQIANCCCETQRNIDSVNYNGAINTASINANTTEQTQKILDAITTNRMADMQNQINQLQMQNAMCGVVRYPMSSAWAMNGNPFCGNTGCGYNNNY